jgi:hypothetical protein
LSSLQTAFLTRTPLTLSPTLLVKSFSLAAKGYTLIIRFPKIFTLLTQVCKSN